MITELHLKNFRGFEDHIVPLTRPCGILLGPIPVLAQRGFAHKGSVVDCRGLLHDCDHARRGGGKRIASMSRTSQLGSIIASTVIMSKRLAWPSMNGKPI